MTENLVNFLNKIQIFDLVFIVLTLLSLIKCTSKGFVLSLLSASKWILAYVLTLFLFPRIKPYVSDLIDNEYILDVVLGLSIFIGLQIMLSKNRVNCAPPAPAHGLYLFKVNY